MLFNSLEFAVFFPIAAIVYFLLPSRAGVFWLLIASCVFYMAFIPAYIAILFVTILIDYVAGIYLERAEGRRRSGILWLSVISTCIVLFVFKYYDFFITSFTGFAALLGWHPSVHAMHIILPVGLSFHTFQSLSYVVEVYRGHQKAERDFVTYATYVMFFPQLVAGPIERPQNLLHQFAESHPFDYERVTSGLKRMAWGFFKKLVVADRLALYVNDVYSSPTSYNGLQLFIATLFFAYQIYCDFSGYSDIALGSARILGFKLMENFDTPYWSRSVGEFWRRWHMSLSTWFKDYVYVSLGGSRVSTAQWMFNIMVTFAISGLWHGANWTFVVWGLLNGFYLVFGALTKPWRERAFGAVGMPESHAVRQVTMVATTFALTCIAWTVFRARDLHDAQYVLTHLFQNWDLSNIKTPQFPLRQFPAALAGIVILEIGQLLHRRGWLLPAVPRLPLLPRWACYGAFVMGTLVFGVYQKAQFIYFQF